jgi:uncharacterized membrane protein YqjE
MTSISQLTQDLQQKFHTPQILRSGWYTTWGMSLLLLITSIYGVNIQRQALKTVGKDAAPSVLTAQQLQDSFAGMDASLASELLLKPGASREKILIDFETNRKKIAVRLTAAAKNITYTKEIPKDATQQEILTLENSKLDEQRIIEKLHRYDSEYLLKLQEARDFHQRGDLVSALSTYQSAATLMDEKIIPKAEELSQLNSTELDKAYLAQASKNGGIAFFITSLGLIQIAILVIIQIFLYQRMRRILNLQLLGATAIAMIFLGYTVGSFVGATANLRVAKEDAFDSLHALRKMRALSYKINADESRYLLDRVNASKHERSFNDGVAKILTLPADQSIPNVIVNVNSMQPEKLQRLTGLFADELKNITFAGERASAIATLTAFNDYLNIDKKIRALNQSGKIDEAIALTLGYGKGESNAAFDEYKKIHTKLMELNKDEFDKNIKLGEERLDNFEVIAAIALSSVALLTLFGLRPRLMEYL